MPRRTMSLSKLALAILFTVAAVRGHSARAGDPEEVNMGMTYLMQRQQQAADLAARLSGAWTVQLDPEGLPASCEVATSRASYALSVAASDSDLVVTQPADNAFPTVTGYAVSDDAARGEVSASPTGWNVLLSGVQRAPVKHVSRRSGFRSA